MSNLSYVVADFVAFTKIKSADVNSRFSDIKAFLNSVGWLDPGKMQNGVNNGFLTYSATGVATQSADAALPFHVESSDPATPSAGYLKLYGKNNKLYTKNDAGAVSAVGSGSAAGVNYITNSDAEADTSGWVTYNDSLTVTITIASPGVVSATAHGLSTDDKITLTTSGALPTGLTAGTVYYVKKIDANSFTLAATLGGADINTTGSQSGVQTARPLAPINGTGGSATTTFTRTTTNPLRGTASFLVIKSAADLAGEGVSYDFSIDRADQGKALNVSFDYTVDTNYVDADVVVFVYDVTNGIKIPVQPQEVEKTLTFGNFSGSFQTPVTSTSYRLCLHVASPNGNAYLVKLDNVILGPEAITLGTPVTDFQAYTPTLTGFGTPTAVNFIWRKVGSSLEVIGTFTSGTSTGVIAEVGLPNGATTAASIAVNSSAGTIIFSDGTANVHTAIAQPSATSINIGIQSAGSGGWTPETGSSVMSSGQSLSLHFQVPVAGWSSNVQMSSEADTRVVAVQLALTGNYIVTATNPVIYDTIRADTHGGYNISTGEYTVPVSGFYNISVVGYNPASGSSLDLYINGVIDVRLCTIDGNLVRSASVSVKLNAGNVITIRSDSNVTYGGTAGGNNFLNSVSIERISGPSQIAASETIACTAYLDASFSASADAIIVYDIKDFDTHDAFDLASATYTVPAAGKYRISAQAQDNNNSTIVYIKKNGSPFCYLTLGTTNAPVFGATLTSLLAGDTITVYSNATTSFRGASTNGNYRVNAFSMERIGI